MAEKTQIPRFDQFLWPTIQALKQSGGSASNAELFNRLVQMMGLSEEVQRIPHGEGPQSEVQYQSGWARATLRLFGAVANSDRGVWSITAKGRSLTESGTAKIPEQIANLVRQLPKPVQEEAAERWKEQLLSVLQEMPSDGFERLAQRVLRESGFVKVEVTGRSGDGGIDGIGLLQINLLSFQVLFQCKRYKGVVSANAVRDFRGAMVGRADKGMLITTGRFTADAKKEATRNGAPLIDLVDGDKLCDLLKALRVGVTTEMVEQVTIQPEVFKSI
jgi:restriction system protein